MSILAAFLCSIPSKPIGIYFLFDGDEVVYVGQSLDVSARVSMHQAARRLGYRGCRWKFDRAAWIPVPEADLDAHERAFIRRLVPRYNTTTPRNGVERETEIAAAFALPDASPDLLAKLERRRSRAFNPRTKKSAIRYRRRVMATGAWLAHQLAGTAS